MKKKNKTKTSRNKKKILLAFFSAYTYITTLSLPSPFPSVKLHIIYVSYVDLQIYI